MASRILESFSCHNLFVDVAIVNGFAEEKRNRKDSCVYVFAVEVYWSDGRMCCVRRTYQDFLELYSQLLCEMKSSKNKECSCVTIPKLQGWKWFRRYDRVLAESRELELHHFVQELLQVNPQIASHPIVLDFFEQRPTDPIPGEANSISQHPHLHLHQLEKHLECVIL